MMAPAVYGGLGFLIACLAFLVIGPLLWRRAVRLTTRRLAERLPMSRADIVAEQDFVRAEAAVRVHALERRAKRLQAEVAEGRIEIGRRDAALTALRAEVAAGQTSAAAAEMLRAENQELRSERSAARIAQAEAESALGSAKERLVRAEAELAAANLALDVQRVEIAALRTDLAGLESAGTQGRYDGAPRDGVRQGGKGRAMQEKMARLQADLLAHAQHGGDDARTAELRERIEELADEIARLAADDAPPDVVVQRRPMVPVTTIHGHA